MKSFKLIAAGILAATVAGTSFATVTYEVKITGSTAFRGSAITAAFNALHANGAVSGAYYNADATGPSMNNSALVVMVGHDSGGNTCEYQFAWSGSLGGAQSVANGTTTIPFGIIGAYPGQLLTSTETWLNPATVTLGALGGGGSGAVTGGTDLSAGQTVTLATLFADGDFEGASAADAAFSDASKADIVKGGYSFSNSPGIINASGTNSAGQVGVITFTWVKGLEMNLGGNTFTGANGIAVNQAVMDAGYARLTNISWSQAEELFSSGTLPLSALTGNTVDAGIDVIVAGRNFDSGTRFWALAEGFGTTPNGERAGIVQVDLQDAYSNTITQINNVAWFYGGPVATDAAGGTIATTTDMGYESGGFVKSFALNIAPTPGAVSGDGTAGNPGEGNGQPFVIISYLGTSDAAGVNSGKNCLLYNGVGQADISGGKAQLTNEIEQGAYANWEYETLYQRTNLSSDTNGALKVASVGAISADLLSTSGVVAGLRLSDLASSVTRSGEFGLPVPQLP